MALFLANALIEGSVGVSTLLNPASMFGEGLVGMAKVAPLLYASALIALAVLSIIALFGSVTTRRVAAWTIFTCHVLFIAVTVLVPEASLYGRNSIADLKKSNPSVAAYVSQFSNEQIDSASYWIGVVSHSFLAFGFLTNHMFRVAKSKNKFD